MKERIRTYFKEHALQLALITLIPIGIALANSPDQKIKSAGGILLLFASIALPISTLSNL